MADCNNIGPRGPMGLRGPAGETGAQGPAGGQGAQGQTGLQGLQGPKGEKGDRGADGAKGLQGLVGPSGAAGIDGLPGPMGRDGANGLDGAKGDQGPAGPKGNTGPAGIQGPQGLTGADGVDGVDGADSFSQAFHVEGEPSNVNSITPALGVTDLCDAAAVLQVMPEIYDDGGEYDKSTGIWTVGATGRYDISFYASLSVLAGWSNGNLKVGVTDPTACIFYTTGSVELSNKEVRAQVSGAAFGIQLTAGDELALKVINASTTNYTTVTGDVVRLTARKVG